MYHLFAVNGKIQICFSIRAKISNLSFYQRFGIQYTIDEIIFSFFLADRAWFKQSLWSSQIEISVIPAEILNLFKFQRPVKTYRQKLFYFFVKTGNSPLVKWSIKQTVGTFLQHFYSLMQRGGKGVNAHNERIITKSEAIIAGDSLVGREPHKSFASITNMINSIISDSVFNYLRFQVPVGIYRVCREKTRQ